MPRIAPKRGTKRAEEDEAADSLQYMQLCTGLLPHATSVTQHLDILLDEEDEIFGITREVRQTLQAFVCDMLMKPKGRIQPILQFDKDSYNTKEEQARVHEVFHQVVVDCYNSTLGAVSLKAPVLLYIVMLIGKWRGNLHPCILPKIETYQREVCKVLAQDTRFGHNAKSIQQGVHKIWKMWEEKSRLYRPNDPKIHARKKRSDAGKPRPPKEGNNQEEMVDILPDGLNV